MGKQAYRGASKWIVVAGVLCACTGATLQGCSDDEKAGKGGSKGGGAGEAGDTASGGVSGSSGGSGTGNGGTSSGGASGRGGNAGNAGAPTGGSGDEGGAAGAGATGGASGAAGEGGTPGGAGGDGPTAACDPLRALGAQGCRAGEKCAWTKLTADTGELACVPNGTVRREAPCAFNGTLTSGAMYDNCAAGLVCAAGMCLKTCDPAVIVGSCNPGEACALYGGIFGNGTDDPTVGECEPTCDPLTQTRVLNGVTTTCGVNRGCYVQRRMGETFASCANAGTPTHNQPLTGPVFANSCAPGHMPRTAVQGTQVAECGALCKPADVYNGLNDGRSGRPDYEGGDPRVMNWNNQPATCESAGGATVLPAVPVTGESCRYYHSAEGTGRITPFSNTLGWCLNHASLTYDPGSGTVPIPRCLDVANADTTPADGVNDAVAWGCAALPPPTMLESPASRRRPERRLRLDLFSPNPR